MKTKMLAFKCPVIRCRHPRGCFALTLANDNAGRVRTMITNYFRWYPRAKRLPLFGTPPSRYTLIAKAFTWSAFSNWFEVNLRDALLGLIGALQLPAGSSFVAAAIQFELIRSSLAMFDFTAGTWALSQLRTLRRP